jgi:hypothetical protein
MKDFVGFQNNAGCGFCWFGYVSQNYYNSLLSSLPRVGVVIVLGGQVAFSSSLLLVCDRSYFVSVYFVFELGLAKTLFCYPVIMEPGSCEAYGKKNLQLVSYACDTLEDIHGCSISLHLSCKPFPS